DDGPGINFFSAIRRGEWKLIYDHKEESLELYNLKNDIGERINVLATQQTIAMDLAVQLTDHLKNWGAKIPIYKDTGSAILWPEVALNSKNNTFILLRSILNRGVSGCRLYNILHRFNPFETV